MGNAEAAAGTERRGPRSTSPSFTKASECFAQGRPSPACGGPKGDKWMAIGMTDGGAGRPLPTVATGMSLLRRGAVASALRFGSPCSRALLKVAEVLRLAVEQLVRHRAGLIQRADGSRQRVEHYRLDGLLPAAFFPCLHRHALH